MGEIRGHRDFHDDFSVDSGAGGERMYFDGDRGSLVAFGLIFFLEIGKRNLCGMQQEIYNVFGVKTRSSSV